MKIKEDASMTKKFYLVTAEVSLVFYQEEEPDTGEIIYAIQNEMALEQIDLSIQDITSLDAVPQKWHDSCPYGDNESALTVAERFAAMHSHDGAGSDHSIPGESVHWKNGQLHFTGTLSGFTGQGRAIVDDVHVRDGNQWNPITSPQHVSMSRLKRGTGITE
jgi:hypothetical protein